MTLDSIRRRKRGRAAWRAAALAGLSWAGLVLATGCGATPQTTPNSADRARTMISADQLLEKLVTSYRQAHRYDDRATIELSYREGDRLVTDSADIAVSFVRPNRLSVKAYKATMHSDGKRFQAWIRDEETNNLDGQVIDRPTPARLTLRDILSDPLLQAQMSDAVLQDDAGKTPIQLELLLAADDLELLTDSSIRKRVSGEETVDGHLCYRAELTTPRGLFILWIDSTNYVLRKLRYPREAFVPALANAQDAQLVAHFRDALLDGPEGKPRFTVAVPEGGRRVRYFVPPPQPLPSDLFGKTVGTFSLQPLDGEPVTNASLRGQTSVLLWFHEHPVCGASLRQVEAVRRKVRGSSDLAPGIAFFGVCTEPSTVDTAQIRAFAARWEVDLPIVRDLAAHGRDLFHFQGAPVLLVLNADGVVQIVEVGANPNLEQELPVILDRLAKGEDVAADVLHRQQQERTRYERELAMASGEEDPSRTAPTEGQILPAAAPRQLKRQQRWALTELRAPGNITVIPADAAGGAARVFVFEGPRTLVEISPVGQVVARRELALPAGDTASNLRFMLDPSGQERYAVTTLLGSEAYLLDKEGALVAKLPTTKSAQGIVDFEWADADGDGASELFLAFAGDRGIEAFDAQGKLRGKTAVGEWQASWFVAAHSSARKDATRLWVGGAQGQPRFWDGVGPPGKPIAVPGRSLQQVFSAAFPAPAPSTFAALANNAQGRQVFVAFNDQFQEQWNYPLPTRATRTTLEPVRSAPLFPDHRPFWILAAADGSVHFISADGRFSDFMSLGESVTGLAVLRQDDDSLVMIATAKGVTAWSFAAP